MPTKKNKIKNKCRKKCNNCKYQVFISHATKDKWLAKTLCEKIETTGATTFRDDRDINGGDDIPETIRQQIKKSKEMIVLLTPKSVGRQWVLLEVGAAWGWRKDFRIVAVLNHVDTDPIPEMIKSKKAIDLNDFDNYLTEIVKRIWKIKNA
jgi:hypothetical protein